MSDEGRLAELTLALVGIESVSRNEDEAVRFVRDRAAGIGFDLADDRDTCLWFVPARRRPEVPLVLFAGHLDTVPVAGNLPGRFEDGVIHGRGASDQKAGVAVMIALQQDIASGWEPALDAAFLYFGREEIDESALTPCLARHPDLAEDTAIAIVTEPTDNAIEAGCLGNLNARVSVEGVAAHSARPWLGSNAIHGGIAALAAIADLPVRDVEIDGLTYREVINVTTIAGGTAANVIPDRLEATINLRYAPTHSPAEAEARLRELLAASGAQIQVMSNAAGGPVAVSHPLVTRLRGAGAGDPRPKQAWTPVAEFGEAGVAAINCGPGDPATAHRDDEHVTVEAIERGYRIARRFLGDP